MRKLWPIVLLIGVLALSACGQATATSTAAPTATTAPVNTPESSGATSVPTLAPLPTSSGPAECRTSAVVPFGTPDPTQAAAIPPITENDWVLGPETASVTIMEYSDYQ